MRLANQTRPDVSDAVRAVARVARPPKPKHWKAARGILEYLKGTSSYGVTFQRGSGLEPMIYAGAAYAPKRYEEVICLGCSRDLWACGRPIDF